MVNLLQEKHTLSENDSTSRNILDASWVSLNIVVRHFFQMSQDVEYKTGFDFAWFHVHSDMEEWGRGKIHEY